MSKKIIVLSLISLIFLFSIHAQFGQSSPFSDNPFGSSSADFNPGDPDGDPDAPLGDWGILLLMSGGFLLFIKKK
tara:strand:+ start:227 stop:451 length:225 start_codon:yes stop_codon:yes gene_type:complete